MTLVAGVRLRDSKACVILVSPVGQRSLPCAAVLIIRRRGSHVYLRIPHATSIVTVPDHAGQILPIGTLHAILRQAGLSLEEFVGLL